jgi:transposase
MSGRWTVCIVNRDGEILLQQRHDPQTLERLRSVPGIGPIFSLVWLYKIHEIHRFPRVQDVASYGRVVKCAHGSAGKRYGPSGHNIGNVHLTWAFSEAAVLFLSITHQGSNTTDAWRKHTVQG